MFKLESYIAPFIMGYIDQYVQLKQEDFQISLWGGDAVLNKLDLRLEAIENAVQLPITLKSGHIHELRIHVPWTNFGSESVIITINTIECVVKLRDSASDDQSSGSGTSRSTTPQKRKEAKNQQDPDEDLPPGYLQGYINKILNNVNIVVNNLILKFVEDDMVLSVNIKSAELYSVNENWIRSFIELEQPELVLRRVLNVHDLTACLDKRNASGKIETYQDPLMYRCSLTCRIHTAYDSLHAKFPAVTRVNILCEKLDLSLTDTQVPMFFRLVELWLAIYYGTLEFTEEENDGELKKASDIRKHIETQTSREEREERQGWTSWAWSYVPQILPADDDDDDDETPGAQAPKRRQPPIFSFGAFCRKASLTFKISEVTKASNRYGAAKASFKPCILWEAEGIGIEILMRGVEFFAAQFGISSTRMFSEGAAICGVNDTENSSKDLCFLRSGQTGDKRGLHFLSASLFDPNSAENQGQRKDFITSQEKHMEMYTETFSIQKYGALFLDYCYVMETTDEYYKDSMSSASSVSEGGPAGARENSCLRVIVAPAYLAVSSSMVQRLHKFLHCMNDHEYAPYAKEHTDQIVNPKRKVLTEEEVKRLEEFIPTRSMHLTLLRPHICFNSNDLPPYDVAKKHIARHRKATKEKGREARSEGHESLPALLLQAERVDFQTTTAMYPHRLVRDVTSMTSPSHNLLHHAHAHTYVKVFGLQLGLTCIGEKGKLSAVQNLLQPWSGAYYKRTLLQPKYWKNPLQPRVEVVYELPQLAVNVSKPQLALCWYIANSWLSSAHAHNKLFESSLMDDVFKSPEEKGGSHPILEMVISNCEVKHCYTEAATSVSVTLTSLQVMLIVPENDRAVVTPLLYGPVDNSQLHRKEFFQSESLLQNDCQVDVIMCTAQLPKDATMPLAPGVVFFEMQGIIGSLDLKLYDWLTYAPIKKPVTKEDPVVKTEGTGQQHIDSVLAEAAHPLKGGAGDSQSESNVTNPTDGLTKTQTHSQTQSQTQTQTKSLPAATPQKPVAGDENEKVEEQSWGRFCALWYPFIQMMHFQVEIHPCCIFFPDKPIILHEPTMNIALNMRTLYRSGALADTLLACLPRVQVLSAAHKHVSPLQDLPIKVMEQSIAGEKLPWSVTLSDMCLMTLRSGAEPVYMARPCHVASTVAVTCTYEPPASQHIAALGGVLHCDAEQIAMAISKPQVQLLCNISLQFLQTVIKCMRSIEVIKNLSTKIGPITDVPEAPPTAPCPVVTKQSVPSNSSMLDAFDSIPMEIEGIPTETLESDSIVSRGDSPVNQDGRHGNIKLSLWLQCTLPKSIVKFYTKNGPEQVVRVSAVIEEVSASLDMHQVYTKFMSKVGSVNVTHAYRPTESKEWCKGNFQGLLFTSSDHITTHTHIVTHKYERQKSVLSSPCTEQLVDVPPQQVPDKAHTFVNVTFTRALKRNVKKRLRLADGDVNVSSTSDSLGGSTDNGMYLNELCVNVQSCDAILNGPVISQVLQIFLADLQHLPAQSVPRNTKREKRRAHTLPYVTANNLPLLYINSGRLRLFVPRMANSESVRAHKHMTTTDGIQVSKEAEAESAVNGDVRMTQDARERFQLQKQTRSRTFEVVRVEKLSRDDMFVFEVVGLSLLPQADNPLPRLVIDRDIYRRALQAGMTSLPGSDVEDRQYQLDVMGWSLTTGRWGDLLKHKVEKKANETQNPALEWNNMTATEMAEAAEFLPVASGFDLRVIAAPAVLFHSQVAQPSLVCGHSLEVNATSDLDFFISLEQIALAERVYSSNINAVLSPLLSINSNADDSAKSHTAKHLIKQQSGTLNDSGVESDLSTTRGYQVNKPAVMATIQEQALPVSSGNEEEKLRSSQGQNVEYDGSKTFKFTPFNVLLTAGRISMSIYKHIEEEKSFPDTAASGNKTQLRKSDLEAPIDTKVTRSRKLDRSRASTEECSTLDSGLPEQDILTLRKVVPVLYVFFSQPHSLMSFESRTQKIELSCYDLVLKGAKPGYTVVDGGSFIPEPSDYTVHWIDTKSGKPNPKTGIPPSLYTFRITDFLNSASTTVLHVERPLKLNLSIAKLEQILSLVQDTWKNIAPSVLTSSSQSASEASLSEATQAGSPESAGKYAASNEDQMLAALAVLTKVEKIELHTVQLVVALETVPCAEQPMVQLSCGGIDGQVTFVPHTDKGMLSEVNSNVKLKNLLLKTSYFGKSRPLIGPLTCDVTGVASWLRHSGAAPWPQVTLSVHTGIVPVNIGQAHVTCLKMIGQHLQQYVQTLSKEHNPNSGQSPDENSAEKSEKTRKASSVSTSRDKRSFTDTSEDDLRSGLLHYVTIETSVEELPEQGEILFSNDFTCGRAAITWSYSESRAITHLSTKPVPFNLPQYMLDRHTDEHLTVPCVLQAWDSMTRQFRDYAQVDVSEHYASDVQLPSVAKEMRHKLMASQVWRVLIGRPDEAKPQSTTDDKSDLFIEPLLSPLSLAASLKINSCFSRHLVPMIQMTLCADDIRIAMTNHSALSGARTPRQLEPFTVDEGASSSDQQVAVIQMEAPTLACRHFAGAEQIVEGQFSVRVGVDVVEFRNLCTLTLLEPFDLELGGKLIKAKGKPATVTSTALVGPATLNVCPSAVHTLSTTVLCWKQISDKALDELLIAEHYIVCNDTLEPVRIGQVGTGEEIRIASRTALPYSWRSHKESQALRMGVDRLPDTWCEAFCLDNDGRFVKTMSKNGESLSLVVHVKQVTNVQKQVIISGCLVISNQVTQPLDVKVLTTRQDKSDKVMVIDPKVTLPSFVLEPKQMKAIKVRLGGQKVLWSQEVSLIGNKTEQSKLIKIPSQDSVTHIHVWCQIFRQTLEAATQTFVIFTPLFVFKSQLPAPLLVTMETPRLKTLKSQELIGRNAETQVLTLSGDMTHNFTFQLSANMKPSKPAIQLNADMIEQVSRQSLDDVTGITTAAVEDGLPWPYSQANESPYKLSSHSASTKPTPGHQDVSLTTTGYHGEKTAEKQPNIDLQVTLSQWRPGSNTLLVDVAPYLLFCNRVELDLWVIANGESHWKLPARQMWAPPLFTGAFRLGLVVENELQLSKECSLSEEDNQARYLPAVPGLLYMYGDMRVSVPIQINAKLNKMCFLSLHSTMHKNMRVVTIREAFNVTSQMTHDVDLMTYCVPLSLEKVKPVFSKEWPPQTVEGCVKQTHPISQEILFWKVLTQEDSEDEETVVEEPPEFVHYILFKKNKKAKESLGNLPELDSDWINPLHWSCPMRIKVGECGGSRQDVVVLDEDECGQACAEMYDVSTVYDKSVTYLMLSPDMQPQLEIHNNTAFALHFGQSYTDAIQDDIQVYEEVELIEKLPVILQYSSAEYTFPMLNAQYPEPLEADSQLKLHFAACTQTTELWSAYRFGSGEASDRDACSHRTHKLSWSQAVNIYAANDCCISIPGMSDVKVHLEQNAHTVHLYIDPISRAEISAKEVRSRIKGEEKVKVISQTRQHSREKSPEQIVVEKDENSKEIGKKDIADFDGIAEVKLGGKIQNRKLPDDDSSEMELNVSVLCSEVSLVLQNEEIVRSGKKWGVQYRECVRVTLDNILVLLYPHPKNIAQLTAYRKQRTYGLSVLVSDLQMDNQMQKHGRYDFPVILHHQDNARVPRVEKDFFELLLADRLEFLRREGFVGVEIGIAVDYKSGPTVQDVLIRVAPLQLFIEDTFVYDLLKILDRVVPVSLANVATPRDAKQPINAPPLDVRLALSQFNKPIRLQLISIEPIRMDLSVHASLKLFIASDHSPLKFSKFEKTQLCVSSSQLARAVAMHYASGAIFRAGWVVGSLELLGNPTGLVRSVGTGVADLFKLPYDGLTRGPGAFLSGVSNGMTSFVKNVTSGTLTSVTNFASSVSRNMDRLSLDADHVERQEASRHHRPTGLSEGLKNGLTGFGLSLLGAIAGLADQPLQTLTRDNPQAAPSPSQRATGLVSGVGKGLVGAITKPLGGAAEFVSQTSMGLLQGTGLARYPTPRRDAPIVHGRQLHNSSLKASQKVLDPLFSGSVVTIIQAVQNLHGDKPTSPMTFDVILTDNCLVVLGTASDCEKEVFSLAEVECCLSRKDNDVLYVTVNGSDQTGEKEEKRHADVQDRIQAFVKHVTRHSADDSFSQDQEASPGSRALKEGACSDSIPHKGAFNYKFHVENKARDIFIELFKLHKDRHVGHGFPL